MTPKCTVVIITWNRRTEVERALESVFAQTIAADLEVIVIDNGSTDGTVEWLRDVYTRPVRLFTFAKNEGASNARNAGIKLAQADFVCFLDSDAEIMTPDAIERCLAALHRDTKVRAVSGSIWFDRENTRPFCLGGYITREGLYDQRRSHSETADPDFLSTCFAVWEKQLLVELRGFDPWYFWGIEDMDLSLRARWAERRGEQIAASRYAIVEGVDVLHEMASGGRHYQPGNFSAAFHACERQRLRLVLGYGGLRKFFRVLIAAPFSKGIVAHEWRNKLTTKQTIAACLVYPLLRLICLPANLIAMRENHLESAPVPKTTTK